MSHNITFTLDVSTLSDEVLVAILRERGYDIDRSNSAWETPGEFCQRLGTNKQSFSRLMHRRTHPFVEMLRPNGKRRTKNPRILSIKSNPHFETYLLAHLGRHKSHKSHNSQKK